MTLISEKALSANLRNKINENDSKFSAYTILTQLNFKYIEMDDGGDLGIGYHSYVDFLPHDSSIDGGAVTIEDIDEADDGDPPELLSNVGWTFNNEGTYEIEIMCLVRGTYMTSLQIANFTQFKANNNNLIFNGSTEKDYFPQIISPIINNYDEDANGEYFTKSIVSNDTAVLKNITPWKKCVIKSYIIIDATNINDQFVPVIIASNEGYVQNNQNTSTTKLFSYGAYGHPSPASSGDHNETSIENEYQGSDLDILNWDDDEIISSGNAAAWRITIKHIED